jgi:hypothetical protein
MQAHHLKKAGSYDRPLNGEYIQVLCLLAYSSAVTYRLFADSASKVTAAT